MPNKKFLSLLCLGLSLSFLTGCNNSSQSSVNQNSSENSYSSESSSIENEKILRYNLKFEQGNLIHNYADSSFGDSVAVGNITKNPNHDGALFNGSGKGESYILIPSDVFKANSITLSYWVYVPFDGNNKAGEFYIDTDKGYFSSVCFDTDNWWGYNVSTSFGGNAYQLTCPSPDSSAWGRTATSDVIEPIFDSWYHMAYVFDKDSFKIIKNGREVFSESGDFSLLDKNVKEFRLGTSNAQGMVDFKGSISDLRVYGVSLNEKDIKREYNLSYEDFLTTDYEFDDEKEKVRNYHGVKNGNPIFEEKDGRKVMSLDGLPADPSSRTSLTLPNHILHGHDEITISTDVFINNTSNRYQRIFEFSIGGQRYLSLYVGFSNVNDLKLEFTNYANNYRDILLDSNYTVPVEKWINITFVADGKTATLYVDGLPICVNNNFRYCDDTFWYYPDMHCSLGRTDFYNDYPFSGYYDNMKIYSTALTEKEVMMREGIITIEDDYEAVKKAYDELEISYSGGMNIDLPKYGKDGVKISYSSSDESVIDGEGYVYPNSKTNQVALIAKLQRGECLMEKEFNLEVKPLSGLETLLQSTSLEDERYNEDSTYYSMMKTNIDYMFSLNMERLLYNYRRIAGLDTKGYSSYPAWISPTSNGAGQFESMYVGALARYTLSMPEYVGSDGTTCATRVKYMISEMRKCQLAFSASNPTEKGYFGAISIKCFKVIRNGGTALGDGTNAWVPYYMLHKNLQMALDVYTYFDDEETKSIAKDILIDCVDWVYQEISSMSETERNNVLNFEFGGMTETLYKTYALTKNANYLRAAHFFEQKSFLDSLYQGKNVLEHIHANTAIPKILGCAAAYEVTGDEYYKTIVLNFYKMTQKMDYANGGLGMNEFFEEEGITSEGNYGEETCCSYNMLKICDYIFRWNKDSNIADYFENVFYNHIMCSMDPLTGGKTYPVSTAFGYYKVYSTADSAFWCCCCTGQETFSKLTYGQYYLSNENGNTVTVNLFNPMTLKVSDSLSIIQTGNIITSEKTRLTIKGQGRLTISLRVPSWCKNPKLSINAGEVIYEVNDGYIYITRDWNDNDYIDYTLPMNYRMELRKGSDKSYALFYGPLMLVADLGNDDVQDIQSDQTAFGTPYDGDIVPYMVFEDDTPLAHITKNIEGNKLKFELTGQNQVIDLIPFMDCYHNRYSMYLEYYLNGENPSEEYIFDGESHNVNIKSDLSFYKTTSYSNVETDDNNLSVDANSEMKAMLEGVSLDGNFEVGAVFKATSSSGAINSGIYLFASNIGNGQDKIDALNVQIERSYGSSSATINLHKFSQTYNGVYKGARGSVKVNADGSVKIKVVVKDGYLYVMGNDNLIPSIKVYVGDEYHKGMVGLRSQFCAINISDFYYKK